MNGPGASFEGPFLLLPGGVLLVRGQALADVATALTLVGKTQRANGFPTPARVVELASACSVALSDTPGGSATGSAVFRKSPGLPLSDQRVGVLEAATLMGVSTRRIRAIADELGGRKVGGSWVFDREVLQAEAERRKRAR